ncbi:MAG: alpha/beta hydrolase, partial [Ferruginibacter sp.]|nr:alpha/beta hydrolase [Ferruginibacter sp.]
MTEKNIEYNNCCITYRIFGEGLPVMLLHGFGEDGHIWQRQIDFLSTRYKLVVPDLPGSGKSDPLRTNNITIDDYAECVKMIVSNEQLSSFVMIGHSMGGYITLAYAEKYKDDLYAFGLFHSTALADSEEKIKTRRKAIQFIATNGSRAFLETAVPGLFHTPSKHKDVITKIIETGGKFPPENLIQYYEAMMNRPERTSILRHTKKPVLLIAGKHDN